MFLLSSLPLLFSSFPFPTVHFPVLRPNPLQWLRIQKVKGSFWFISHLAEGGYGEPTDQDIPVVQLPHNSYQIYDPEDLYDEFTPVREEMEAAELRSPGISRFTRKISKRSIDTPIHKKATGKKTS
ncbi:PREDICTED: collagen alpha-1(XIV) chain-like [Tinamus guttatus]|uniref:collagen alpha-1(XIV) chain-like n=1 Tax=Tinamus guttatus TaxID=94827 RepID=UPI00052F125D|nr:PREDICTED: collagen alpha-1(XIV) chain-like [Tinamus guttatus]